MVDIITPIDIVKEKNYENFRIFVLQSNFDKIWHPDSVVPRILLFSLYSKLIFIPEIAPTAPAKWKKNTNSLLWKSQASACKI